MNRMKKIALLMGAVCALSALVASSAQAAEFTGFNTAKGVHEGGTISASQSTLQEFQVTTGLFKVTCKTATFTGTSATGTDATLTITPTYKECEANTENPATVTLNGCDYIFKVGKEVTEGAHKGEFEGTVDIKNCKDKTEGIQVHIFKTDGVTNKCTIDVEEQEGIGPIYYKNIGAAPNTEVEVTAEAHNIKTDATQGVLSCGTSEGTHNEGTLFGNAKVKLINGAGTQIDATIM